MKRFVILITAASGYLVGLAAIVYYAGFLIEMGVPKSINSGTSASVPLAVSVNILLLIVFGFQHSVMARKGFKLWIKRWIPAALERSFYILMSSLAVGLICWLWIPLPYELYDFRSTIWNYLFISLYAAGWAVGLFSTFLIDHFDLFGLKQAWHHWKGRSEFSYQFHTPLLYRIVRHPIYLGWLMIHWFTPRMTMGHLLFAAVITIYIHIAVYFEERDLVQEFGEKYRRYQHTTPKLIPVLGQKNKEK